MKRLCAAIVFALTIPAVAQQHKSEDPRLCAAMLGNADRDIAGMSRMLHAVEAEGQLCEGDKAELQKQINELKKQMELPHPNLPPAPAQP